MSDAYVELAHRHIYESRWREAETAAARGIDFDGIANEALWRARIIAAFASGNRAKADEIADRLTVLVDQAQCDLNPETAELLAMLDEPGTQPDQLTAALAGGRF